MKEWVALWKVGGKVKPKIICTSKTIYNNAHHAQPDNAFDYVVCRGAWEFLKYGLNLKLDVATPKEEQLHFWEYKKCEFVLCYRIRYSRFFDTLQSLFLIYDIFELYVYRGM